MQLLGASYLADPALAEKVTIAKVNADKWHELGSTYDVPGYPTLIWVPRGGKPEDGKQYKGQRNAVSILEFIREELRSVDAYARVSELTDIAVKMAKGDNVDEMLAEAKEFVSSLEDASVKANGALYIKYMEKFVTKGGMEYVEREITRLNKLIDGGMSPAKQQEVDRKLSVLTTFASS
jgi:hypothetical protein